MGARRALGVDDVLDVDDMAGRRKGKKGRKARLEDVSLHQLKQRMVEMVAQAWAPGSKKVIKTSRRALAEFAKLYADERPVLFQMPLFFGDLQAGVHNEETWCLFAIWLHDSGLAPTTVGTYVSMAKSSVTVELGCVLSPKESELRLPRLLKAIRKTRANVRKGRLGWRARYQRQLREMLGEVVGLEAATQDAMLNSARQGLLRAADFLPEKANLFKVDRHACVGDVTELDEPRPHLKWMVEPAKKRERRGKTEMLLLPKGDGVTDAYTSIKRMLDERRKLAKAKGRELGDDEPLFWTPTMGVAQVSHLYSIFKSAAECVGVKGKVSAQSGRIGGASDLFATNCSPALLEMMGRW